MPKWILAAIVALALAAAGPTPAQSDNSKKPLNPDHQKSVQPQKTAPAQATRPAATQTRTGLTAQEGAARLSSQQSPNPRRSEKTQAGRPSSSGHKGSARPGQGSSVKPGDRPGHGAAVKPGDRPGDRDHDRDRRGRRRHNYDRCDPYCYGPGWYDYYGYYRDVPNDEDDFREESYPAPQTYFSPGRFEFFQDPRLDWAAEGGLGQTADSPPPPGTRPADPAAERRSDDDQRRYEQMMRTWR